jgi:hypothetical protein
MDVVINSNIQSPLVRTLARTKGKSESFTQHLKDNVPPVSFSKIELAPEGGSTASYNQTYKFKIPQYGYLRNFILRFSNTELPIPAALFTTLNTAFDAMATDKKEMIGVERLGTGSGLPNTANWMWHGLVPADEGNNCRNEDNDPWVQMWLRVAGGYDLTNTLRTAKGGARMTPFRYKCRSNIMNANRSNYGPREYANLGREGPFYAISGGVLSSTPASDSNHHQVDQLHGERIASTWDWCSQANLSKHLGALFPETITLTTHNRPIQTIYPMESLARIYRMPLDIKKRYLAMIRPHITASPGTTAIGNAGYIGITGRTETSSYGTNRSWTCYFPCFFAFFEDTSMNLDTRFIENLEVDVKIRAETEIYDYGDIGLGSTGTTVFSDEDNYGLIGSDYVQSRIFNTNLMAGTDRKLPTTFILEAVAYYHNFHDTTSQAIRDANYKPNVPANLLTYNTYAENPVFLSQSTVTAGGSVNVSLSCNNLTFGITLIVRRRAASLYPEFGRFTDFSQTLPIKQITLTGSGQQLYKATGAEALLVDSWDHPLSSMKSGFGLTNTTGLYADNHQSMYVQSKDKSETFFAYYIPFGFSQDMTYNSGSLALQTINNPVLTVELFPLEGWVLQDENMGQYLSPFCNKNTLFQERAETNPIQPQDNEFEIVVYENFWQMTRIDSNTGSITKSLDL